MARKSSVARQPALSLTLTPAREHEADALVRSMAALDHAVDQAAAEKRRQDLQKEAEAMGMRLLTYTVTTEPIPDPAIDALSPAEINRIEAVRRELYIHPERQVAELERLVARHPNIPMLRNHLFCALSAAGEDDRATEVLVETIQQFPTYIFALCNYVLGLISEERLDEARALVETGPRGPLFTLSAIDPTRDTFHISEASAHSAMVGHYLLATGRREAAEFHLNLLRESDPDSPQCQSLEAAMDRDDLHSRVAAMMQKAMARLHRPQRKKKATAARKKRNKAQENPSLEPAPKADAAAETGERKPDTQPGKTWQRGKTRKSKE